MARIFRGLGALPSFDMTDPIVGALSAKIGQAQSISATATAYMTDPAVKGAVEGAEQQIAAAYNDVVAASQRVRAAAANTGSMGEEAGKPMQRDFQYSGGGGQFQAALLSWQNRPEINNYYRPDPADYQYPGGGGQLDGAMTRWRARAANDAAAARATLAAVLDNYNSKVPAAIKADQDLAQARTVAQTVDTTAGTTKVAADTFVAQQNLQTAVKQAEVAAASVAGGGGPSPLIIAAIAVPLVGVAIWALTRKKSGGAVAGYRRRKRSRRSR